MRFQNDNSDSQGRTQERGVGVNPPLELAISQKLCYKASV